MKRSEELRAELAALEAADEKARREMVDPRSPDYEALWNEYWKKYGREATEKKDNLESQIRTEENREIAVGDGVTLCLYTGSRLHGHQEDSEDDTHTA